MKKWSICLLGALLLITACSPDTNEEVVQEEDTQQETSIVPSYQLSDENYKMILPYEPSKARGVIVNQVANRMDIDEMEEGLRRHSKEVYDPSKYFFQEGQYLDEDTVYDWLGRELTESQLEEAVADRIDYLEENKMTVNEENIRREFQLGLNPPIEDEYNQEEQEANPKYLSHILEHNFLSKNEDNTVKLEGISIGLAMKSVYRFQTKKDGPYSYLDISQSEMMEQATVIAEKVVNRIRNMEGLENVPIMIAVYREQERSSPIPGNYVAKMNVAGGETSLSDWDNINEQHVLFPSDEGKKEYFDDHELVTSFGNEIANYFPNYVGIIGEGFYINDELKKLTIEIPIEFYGKAEVIGFSQYAYGLVQDMFEDYYDLELMITSSDKVESTIFREAGSDTPTVRIFH
ncbi:CamS family sex pheromone protein [Oceanobacillus jordanicus]|uniref:CamS family sex pheromone protein n=1 Tax=Oceanobacillus jordanicus TaxID=2867266 RepID=A0AAW5B5Y5_9BACI|nr:CamS family sex pheromone protein [Oceanobacillus jordanicus]MCG3419806.1 CamS family sex pheromone protein [Oceanobacillus jordanicus]